MNARLNLSTAPESALEPTGDLQARCQELGEMLQLDEPVPLEVLRAAVGDEIYARNLLTARNDPQMLRILMAKPLQCADKKSTGLRQFSNLELASKAANAILRWGRTGFSVADAETRDLRLRACAICPNLTEASDQLAYKLVLGRATDGICRLCGCSVKAKSRLPSEVCPDRDPNDPEKNRWGQAWHSSE